MAPGASATVVGKGGVRAVKASDPDPSRRSKMADGKIIPNSGEKLFRAHRGQLHTRLTNHWLSLHG